MAGDVNLTRRELSEYFIKTFPGFERVREQRQDIFYNLLYDFFAVPYFGKLAEGVDLTHFANPYTGSGVSLISLYACNGKTSFTNRLINNSLLSKYITNRRAKAEKEDLPFILTRADISDLFSGRGRDEVFVAVNCPNRFVPASSSLNPPIMEALLNPSQDSLIIDYITENNLI